MKNLTRDMLIGLLLGMVMMGCAQERQGPTWYKGNLHTHSLWSDGDDFPEMIALWYRERGYDFLGLSDHNTLGRGEKWMKYSEIKKRGAVSAYENYKKTFGETVKTRGEAKLSTMEVRLRGLEEWRVDVEREGKFLMIPSEEITGNFKKLPLHMNATNLVELVKPPTGSSISEMIAKNVAVIEEQAKRLGRPIIVHLNHPNFGWGVSVEDIAVVVEERFFEVYNGHPATNSQGDKKHMNTDRMWDIANTMRMVMLGAPPMYGLAVDDSHNYHIDGISRAAPGRGWICVKAKDLSADAIIAAMKAGDFYASSGVELADVRWRTESRVIEVEIAADGDAEFVTEFVGTRADFADEPTTKPSTRPLESASVGRVLASVRGRFASYSLRGDELYVRAIVTSSKGPKSPSYKGQKAQAWTQPVGWEKWLARPAEERPAQ